MEFEFPMFSRVNQCEVSHAQQNDLANIPVISTYLRLHKIIVRIDLRKSYSNRNLCDFFSLSSFAETRRKRKSKEIVR